MSVRSAGGSALSAAPAVIAAMARLPRRLGAPLLGLDDAAHSGRPRQTGFLHARRIDHGDHEEVGGGCDAA